MIRHSTLNKYTLYFDKMQFQRFLQIYKVSTYLTISVTFTGFGYEDSIISSIFSIVKTVTVSNMLSSEDTKIKNSCKKYVIKTNKQKLTWSGRRRRNFFL